MPKDRKNPIAAAILIAQQEVTGQRPREPEKRQKETHQIALDSFFGGGRATGPKQPSNAPLACNAEAAVKPPERPNFRGQIVRCADGSLRNISECWQDLFKCNEKWMYDDATLYCRMLDLFPGREESKHLAMVQRIRSQYNSGRLPGMVSPPEIRSRRFRRVGDKVYEITPRGIVIREVNDASEEQDSSAEAVRGNGQAHRESD